MPARPPAGRAGRVWLAGRVEAAQRAAELLEHKQRLLRHEERRLAALVERTSGEWRDLASDAQDWSARALVAGGRDELRRAAPRVEKAETEIGWATRAGVTYPATAATRRPATAAVGGAVALARAAEACGRALDAGVQHAAASAALARVAGELVATTRRMRAIRDRWLPELRAQLEQLDLRLDEVDREEVTHLRWAQQRQPPEAAAR